MIIKKWGIYRADLDPVIGSEQGKARPVLIISEDQINDLLNIENTCWDLEDFIISNILKSTSSRIN